MDKRSIWRGLWLVGLSACGGGLGGLLVSNAQEVEMGIGVAEQISYEQYLAAPNDPVSLWASQLLTPLVENSRDFRDPDEIGGYKVAVIVDDALVNAFAAPGGFTYLSTGLILEATSCAEIAGVMGHELGHVTERHGVKRVEEGMAVGLLADIFLGEGITGDVAQGLYGFLLNTTFSQDAEEESDWVGLQIAYGAGYNPYGLVDFFERLQALSAGNEDLVSQFLSSHPSNSDRIAGVSAEIERRYGSAVQRNVTQSYGCVGTSMTLMQIKEHIRRGNVQILAGTGEGPPTELPVDGAAAEDEQQ